MAEGREPVAWAGRRAVVTFPEHVDGSNVAQVREQLLTVFRGGAAVASIRRRNFVSLLLFPSRRSV
jgi:hypothetical protein